MRAGFSARMAVAAVIATAGIAALAAAATPKLAALAAIEPGEWQFKTVDSDAAPRSVCIANAESLIQFGHATVKCSRFVIANEADSATVHYKCAGGGHGQTSIKVATPRTFNLETQGIINGAPFEERYEARRIGACTP